ncbi:DUF4358 domain-containing protein [Eubacteriales bacterium OttesenSCG-928-A19]|nr:DUF4358 domain-containing protein [Eubacteriales bacterium OttesenSCG-928-A19]
MKRTMLRALPMLLCAALLFGGAMAEDVKPCADILAAVEAEGTFEELTALSEAQILKYLDLEEGMLSDLAMSMDASRATAEMIAVLTATDEDALEIAQEALEAYRDVTLEQYRNYQPTEIPKLEDAVLLTKGLQTALIVSGDAEQAEKALEEAW